MPGSYPGSTASVVRVSWNYFLNSEKESYVPFLLSVWILMSVPSLFLVLGEGSSTSFLISSLSLISVMVYWVMMVIKEASLGAMTWGLKSTVRFSFILFIASEVAFFASFFWGFYAFSMIPVLEIGGTWPQENLCVIDGFGVPLLNTVILLSSGVSVTWAHKAMLHSQSSVLPLVVTLGLGMVFLVIQISEYASASFSIADGVYGSVFFLLTGFHGFHVLVGCLMLAFSLARCSSFSKDSHVGFECAAWYWHFVDVVWLFLFSFVYLWSQGIFSYLSELIGVLW